MQVNITATVDGTLSRDDVADAIIDELEGFEFPVIVGETVHGCVFSGIAVSITPEEEE